MSSVNEAYTFSEKPCLPDIFRGFGFHVVALTVEVRLHVGRYNDSHHVNPAMVENQISVTLVSHVNP